MKNTSIRVWKKTQLRLKKQAVMKNLTLLEYIDRLSLGEFDKSK